MRKKKTGGGSIQSEPFLSNQWCIKCILYKLNASAKASFPSLIHINFTFFFIKDFTRIPDNCRPCEIDNWESPVPGGISTTSISSFPQETPLVNFWSALITWRDRIQIIPCEKYVELYKIRSASFEGKKQYTNIWIDFQTMGTSSKKLKELK